METQSSGLISIEGAERERKNRLGDLFQWHISSRFIVFYGGGMIHGCISQLTMPAACHAHRKKADVCATVNNVSRWEPGPRHVHFISIHNSLADVGLYRFPGICKESAEIATSLWSCFYPPLFIYLFMLFIFFALLLRGNVQPTRSANPS